ncbi:MAG: sphingosine kinase [Pseudonocardiaceae bacterium]|nr:sphingosine kinase [Pseudonocardiaceae bacterium]
MRAALIVHPDSGRGAAARVAGTVARRLRTAVGKLELVTPTSIEESRETLRRARDGGLELLVVLGGDGAAHQAVQVCAGNDLLLGLIPSGTGNDLARALGMPDDPVLAADALALAIEARQTRRMDLGLVGGTWFATVLCAGFDARVNARVNRMRWPAGRRRFDVATLAELARLRPYPLQVRTPDTELEMPATQVAVGNTRWYGGGIPICPDADPGDGAFDITVVGPASRRDLVRILPRARTGAHVDDLAVRTLRAREVWLGGNNGWTAYADGERFAALPLRARTVPDALHVVSVPVST